MFLHLTPNRSAFVYASRIKPAYSLAIFPTSVIPSRANI